MAEFILFWKDNYMDAWDAAKVASLDAIAKAKYDRRYQRGDIVEVWPDGEGEWRVKGNPQFLVVKVPGLAVDLDMMKALMDISGPTDPVILKRRKWWVNRTKLSQNIINKINSGDRVFTVTLTAFNAFVERKT